MEKENKINLKDVVILDDNREYSVIKKVEQYLVLLSSTEPLKIIVGKMCEDTLKVVTDKNIIIKVLSSI